jgi:hypothetical protein
MVGVDVSDRDQGQAQVPRFLEQAVQRGLVGYRAMDGGGAVAAATVRSSDRKLEADVVRRHHHTWRLMW